MFDSLFLLASPESVEIDWFGVADRMGKNNIKQYESFIQYFFNASDDNLDEGQKKELLKIKKTLKDKIKGFGFDKQLCEKLDENQKPSFLLPTLAVDANGVDTIALSAASLSYSESELNASSKPSKCPCKYWHLVMIVRHITAKESNLKKKEVVTANKFVKMCHETGVHTFNYLHYLIRSLFVDKDNLPEDRYRTLTEAWIDLIFQNKKINFNWKLWSQCNSLMPPAFLGTGYEWVKTDINGITVYELVKQ